MLHQEVGVDYWKMFKSMATYASLSLVGWIMLRLITAIFAMPGRLRAQQARMQNSLEEFQRRFPDLKFTEEELKEVQRELDEGAGTLESQLVDGILDSQLDDGAQDSQLDDGAQDSQLDDGAQDSQLDDGAQDSQLDDGSRDSPQDAPGTSAASAHAADGDKKTK